VGVESAGVHKGGKKISEMMSGQEKSQSSINFKFIWVFFDD